MTSNNNQQQQQQQPDSEPEWTHLSVSTPQPTHTCQQPQGNKEENIESSSDSLVKISDLQLLTQPNQSLVESDSSTSFDPQAWKRGDTGTTKRSKKTTNPHASSSQNPKVQSPLSSSYLFDAAFISPPKSSKSTLDHPSIHRRRATSTTRRASRPIIFQSGSTSTPSHDLSTHNNRSASDLGPSRKKLGNRSNPPTWKAYAGKDATSSSSTRLLSESDRKQEFMEALANLRVMTRVGNLEYISSNSSSSNANQTNNYENDDGDPDEPRPGHADLPTSTFNSAVDEQEAESSNLIIPPRPDTPPKPSPESNLARFFRWSGYIGKAISLKTWQLVGLGGLIFGIGIWAGSLIGRNFSHQKHSSHIFKFFF